MNAVRAILVTVISIAAARPLAAQPPATGATPQGLGVDRGRPTEESDVTPPLAFATYFVGDWTFEWDSPDSVLGTGGTFSGKTSYRAVDGGRFFEAVTTGTAPDGPFTIKETIAYEAANKVVTRWVEDSRGVSYLQSGTVGGDLGGTYEIYFESAPVAFKGKQVRFKHTLRLLSPGRYRNQMNLAVDGAPYSSLGNPWVERPRAAR